MTDFSVIAVNFIGAAHPETEWDQVKVIYLADADVLAWRSTYDIRLSIHLTKPLEISTNQERRLQRRQKRALISQPLAYPPFAYPPRLWHHGLINTGGIIGFVFAPLQ